MQVFLGYPPENVKNWINDHHTPTGHEKTWVWFEGQNNYEEFDWSGEINQSTMIDAGLFNEDYWAWTKNPVKVEIGTNVTSIGNWVFSNCSSLTSITIPDSVTSIGEYAFYDCSSLTSITISDSVTSIGEYAFFNCSSLTSITIPDSVTSIGENAFNGCGSLTSITIPDSVTSIGDCAFEQCSNLTSITILDSVTSIGRNAFYYCTSLTTASILGFTQTDIVANASTWQLGYKYDDDWHLITFPVTVTASDGIFVLHQS